VVVWGAASIVVNNDPSHALSDLRFVPLGFALAWLAAFALRKRAAEVEPAMLRAAYAEHDREGATRIAVAGERLRIGRELHDITAHAVSVVVLQVGRSGTSCPRR
jgi:signal transduction histidine kinase